MILLEYRREPVQHCIDSYSDEQEELVSVRITKSVNISQVKHMRGVMHKTELN